MRSKKDKKSCTNILFLQSVRKILQMDNVLTIFALLDCVRIFQERTTGRRLTENNKQMQTINLKKIIYLDEIS